MTKNLDIPKSTDTPLTSPAKLYSFDKNNGLWVPIGDLSYATPSDEMATTQGEFPAEYPIIASINELLPRRRVCEVGLLGLALLAVVHLPLRTPSCDSDCLHPALGLAVQRKLDKQFLTASNYSLLLDRPYSLILNYTYIST